MVTEGSENWPLSTTLWLIDASLHVDPNEYPHKLYTTTN